jgi:hypothetical protein
MIPLKNKAKASVFKNPLKASEGKAPRAQTPEQQKLPEQGRVRKANRTPKKAMPLRILFLWAKFKKRSTNRMSIAVEISQISVRKAEA